MLGLPVVSHKLFKEPLTGEIHVKKMLISRFQVLMEKIALLMKLLKMMLKM